MRPVMPSITPDEAAMDHEARTNRVFVVHLRVDADPGQGVFRGRVQHVRSGDAAHFDTLDELGAFLALCVGPE